MRIRHFGLVAALALGGLLVCTNSSNAQDAKEGKKRGGSPQQRIEQMDKELKLTADQKTKLTALFEDQRTKMADVRSAPADERRQKMQTMREESDKKIKAILTPDQWEKYQKSREEMRKKGGKKKQQA